VNPSHRNLTFTNCKALSVGRAIYIIQETFPEFFDTGLIMSLNKATGKPFRSSPFSPTTNVDFLEPSLVNDLEEPIYSPNIRMSYTPPSRLPSPFPKTFHIEGMHQLNDIYLISMEFRPTTICRVVWDHTAHNECIIFRLDCQSRQTRHQLASNIVFVNPWQAED